MMKNKENQKDSITYAVLFLLQISYYVKNTKGHRPLKDYIEERAVEIAAYIIDEQTTVRQAAKKFGVSKSTIHKDITDRLKEINPVLAGQVRRILDRNKSERHIRGGLATREKYLHLRE